MMDIVCSIIFGVIVGGILARGLDSLFSYNNNITAKRASRNYYISTKKDEDSILNEILTKVEFASKNCCLSVTYKIGDVDEEELKIVENQLILRGFEVEHDLIHNSLVIFWLA